jgi:hypothetical protein
MTGVIMLRGGEAFWTRTSKRIPRKKSPNGNHRPASNPDNGAEKTSEGGENRLRLKLQNVLHRAHPQRDDKSTVDISPGEASLGDRR